MAEGNGRIAARNPLRSSLAPMVTLRMRANSPGRLCSELNLSGTNPLMVNESKPRSTPTPPREGDEIWGCGGAIALCASRGELHKHAWALRHLGQEREQWMGTRRGSGGG